MTRLFGFIILSVLLAFIAITGSGCTKGDYLDPTQVGRFRPVPAVNVILDSLGVAEEAAPIFAGAEEPKPIDTMVMEEDYVFSPGDTVRISVYELQAEGQNYVNDFVVSETGKVSIPEVGQIQAGGLTEAQLEQEIRDILAPAILREPLVTVILQNSQSRTFSVLGEGVATPGRFQIPRYDFRLADALAVAGSTRQFNVSYIYVIRTVTGREPSADFVPTLDQGPVPTQQPGQNQPAPAATPEDEMMQIIAPSASAKNDKPIIAAADMQTTVETGKPATESIGTQPNRELPSMAPNPAGQVQSEPAAPEETGPVEWVFQDGKWRPVKKGEGAQPQAPTQLPSQQPQRAQGAAPEAAQPIPQQPATYGFEQIGTAGVQKRVMRIPAKEFGDPRYNIVIRPGDVIYVPVDIVGEFYVMGNANNQGVINLTGRPMTLMQAMAAAGGLGPLAWPERVEVRRRIAEKKEEIVLVNLKKIADGSQPDFFIKQNDLINIGTHPAARWLAVLRNAFRATYGFGFIYDRNFATGDFGTDPLKAVFGQ